MSLQLIAKQMEAKGRGGDSVLVHMTPGEVEGLQKLAESAGGSLTVNPETGLVEANFLKRMLPTLAGIGVGMFAGPMAGAAAGALVGGMTAPKKQREMGILMGALGGYGGAGIGAGLGAAGSTAAQAAAMNTAATAGQAANLGAAAGAGSSALPSGLIGAGAEGVAGEAVAQQAANAALQQELKAQAINQAGETAAKDFASQGFASRAGQGIQALAGKPGRDAFLGQVGMKTAGMAAAPLMMAEERKTSETPTDNERYVYDFDYGRTGADRAPVTSTAERTYFQPTYRRIFSAAEGGEVADAAPMDAGIAGGMTGASKAAFDYLMGNAASSAPQGIAAPAVRSAPVVGGDNMYAFDPATGAFIRNPNYRDPASGARNAGLIGQLISGGVGGGDYQPVGPNPDFDTPEKQAAYYAENPTMGAITRAGQDLFGYTKLGMAQDLFAPGFSDAQRDITFGGSLSAGSVNDRSVRAGLGEIGYDDSPPNMSDFDTGGGGQNGGLSEPSGGWSAADLGLAQGGLLGLAKGGMKSGGFVVPADVVSMVGEGNTDAGYSRIKSMIPGATAIKGKDGGQADTVKTSIEGKQPARVAHGEMYIPPETVKRMGGAKKLYAMMDRVRQQATGSKKQIKPVNLRRAMA